MGRIQNADPCDVAHKQDICAPDADQRPAGGSGAPVGEVSVTREHHPHLSRLTIWRARLSVPFLLAHGDEQPVISVFTAVSVGTTILIMSLLAWLCDLPLLYPALAPTLFILHNSPLSKPAAPRSVILGHWMGIVCGAVVLHLITFLTGETISLQQSGIWLLLSASVALAATCICLVRFDCPHPPACASALVIALGGVSTWSGVLYMAIAVVLVTAQASLLNRLACLPVPLWAPQTRNAVDPEISIMPPD